MDLTNEINLDYLICVKMYLTSPKMLKNTKKSSLVKSFGQLLFVENGPFFEILKIYSV